MEKGKKEAGGRLYKKRKGGGGGYAIGKVKGENGEREMRRRAAFGERKRNGECTLYDEGRRKELRGNSNERKERY